MTRAVLRWQVGVRAALVGFVLVGLLVLPPGDVTGPALFVGIGYAAAAGVSSWWLLRARPALGVDGHRAAEGAGPGAGVDRWGWTVAYLDLVALTALTLISTFTADINWTANVLQLGLFVLPVLAAIQLRPRVCVGVCGPTVVLYLVVGFITQDDNDEPTASILLRSLPLLIVCAAAIGLSIVQARNLRGIGDLLRQRSVLIADLAAVGRRERRRLAEDLHDGALQYLLAARGDLEDLRDTGDQVAADRVDEALRHSAELLRGTVRALHPAVVDESGLAAALPSLLAQVAPPGPGAPEVVLTVTDWPADLRGTSDQLVYLTARELLINVVRHADAHRVTVDLRRVGSDAVLVVADDGRGFDEDRRRRRVAQGHVGLESRRVRIVASGGRMTIGATPGGGTTVTVRVPLEPVAPAVGPRDVPV